MSPSEISAAHLAELTRQAAGSHELNVLVASQHTLRAALRRVLVLRQWSVLGDARRELRDSPPLLARFDESLHGVLETPELGAHDADARWHGLVLAIPVALTSRSGTLVSLPHVLAEGLRETLCARFPPGTAIRLSSRPVSQLVTRTMGARGVYELVEELARGAGGAAGDSDFVSTGRSLGQHYLFALAVTARPAELLLELLGDRETEPGLVKWAAAQTERITSDFAERGWPLLLRVSPPRRLREVLSSVPVVSDVRELDGLLEHAADLLEGPVTSVTSLRADLSLARGEDGGLLIAVSDRSLGTPLAQVVYRFAGSGSEASAYRVAVRLASVGVELAAADENLLRAVRRAIAFTSTSEPSEGRGTDADGAKASGLRPRLSRAARNPG